jgi:lysylphosphatidylglycerol synthetase-like protein (DUF2156 family)
LRCERPRAAAQFPNSQVAGFDLDILGGTEMSRQLAEVLYVAAMVIVIVAVDVAFFRDLFWARLIANIGIVLVFGAFYLRFVRLV